MNLLSHSHLLGQINILYSSLPCQKRCCTFEDTINRLAFEDEITTHLGMLNTILKKYTFHMIANHEKNRLIISPNQELNCMFQKKEEDGRYVSHFIFLFLFTLREKENQLAK